MKNTIKILMSAILALAVVGCTENNGENAGNSDRLATPNFTANVSGNIITVAWEEVSGAAYYEVSLDPGSIEKTDKLIHKFEDLQYNTEYKVSVRAIATDAAKNSDAETKKVTTDEFLTYQYREFYPQYGASVTAISNNGRYVVGAYDRNGYIIDLSKDELKELPNAELYDVADDGTAVGSDNRSNPDGNAAIFIGDQIIEIDLSDIVSSPGFSCATGITPDGRYIVGWYWEYDDSTYYSQQYGMIVPFCYDVMLDRITVPEVGNRLYNNVAGTAIKAVSPDRVLCGYEQSEGIHSIIWEDEYTPYEYVHFEYDSNYNPVYGFGDTQNLMSQTGRYIYGRAIDYSSGQVPEPAVYDRETEKLTTFTGASVTAMTDDGIVFINDVPYYAGTTSFVADMNNETMENITLEQWLLDVHGIDLATFAPSCDEVEGDNIMLEGAITVGASEDGRVLVGLVHTMAGYMTYVIDLYGKPMI
jgi:hypothetical protein